jgi:hypothetical protein
LGCNGYRKQGTDTGVQKRNSDLLTDALVGCIINLIDNELLVTVLKKNRLSLRDFRLRDFRLCRKYMMLVQIN